MRGLGLGSGLSQRSGPVSWPNLVTSDAEFVAAHTALSSGDTITLADTGTFTDLTVTKSGLTIQGQSLAPVRSLAITSAQDVTVKRLASSSLVPVRHVDLRGNLDGLLLEYCQFDPKSKFSPGNDYDPSVTDTAADRMGNTAGTTGPTNGYTTLPVGIGTGGSGATAPSGSMTFRRNRLRNLAQAIKFTFGTVASGTVVYDLNDIELVYEDGISLILTSTSAALTGFKARSNLIFDLFSQAQDNVNPHQDGLQISGTSAYPIDVYGVEIVGNIIGQRESGRGQTQGLFSRHVNMVGPEIHSNVIAVRQNANRIYLGQSGDGDAGAAWARVEKNITLALPTANVLRGNEPNANATSGIAAAVIGTGRVQLKPSVTCGSPPNWIRRNLVEAITSNATDALADNIVTGLGDGAADYATWLDADTVGEWEAVTDPDTLLTAMTPKTAYAANSPIVAGETASQFRERIYAAGRSLLSPLTAWANVTGAATSTLTTSGWAFVHVGGAVVPDAGVEWRTASDWNGTGASAWSSTSGTITHGQFAQVRFTSSASASTTVTKGLTIGGVAFAMEVTTASSFAAPIVTIEGTTPDLFRASGTTNLGTDGGLGTFALWNFKMNGNPAAERILFGSSAGNPRVRVSILTDGKIRIRFHNGTAYFTTLDTPASVCDNVAHTVLISWNTNAANVGAGASMYVDGSSVSPTAVWGTAQNVDYDASVTSYQFGMPAVSSMETSGFLLHTAERADLTDSAVRNLFTLDPSIIELDGSGPFTAAPIYFCVGTATQWNDAGGINFGSGAKLIKVGSAAAVDVSGDTWA